MAKILIFNLNDVKCGIELSKVKEIVKIERIIHIPGTPDFVEGLVNLRGEIVTIIDLRKRLGQMAEHDAETPVIIVRNGSGSLGLVVDEISGIAEVEIRDVRLLQNIQHECFFRNIGVLPNNSLVLIIDLEKILPAPSLDSFAILDLLPDPVIVHDGRKIIFANQKAANVFGTKNAKEPVHLNYDLVRERFEVFSKNLPRNSAVLSVFREKPKEDVDVLGVVDESGKFIYLPAYAGKDFEVDLVGKRLPEVFSSDVAEHMLQCIKSAIKENRIVISDEDGSSMRYYIPLTSATDRCCLVLSQGRTNRAKQKILLKKLVEVCETITNAKNREDIITSVEKIFANYSAKISNRPEYSSFTINHDGKKYGHLNVRSCLSDEEKYLFSMLAKNLGFALKHIEDKEKLLEKLSENIELIAYLIDKIRNPLAVIMCYAEFIEKEKIKQNIISQVKRITSIISKLDEAWTSSEDILKKLQARKGESRMLSFDGCS